MEKILERLEGEAWVRGSMIVSHEGMVVVQRVSKTLDRDAVAALASDLVTEVVAGLNEARMEPFRRIVQDERFLEIPKILETPKDPDPVGNDLKNLGLLRGFRRVG